MSDQDTPVVVATLEDDGGLKIVDILRHPEGHFTYVELHLSEDDAEEAWNEVVNEAAKTYATEFAAYTAATRTVDWLMD